MRLPRHETIRFDRCWDYEGFDGAGKNDREEQGFQLGAEGSERLGFLEVGGKEEGWVWPKY